MASAPALEDPPAPTLPELKSATRELAHEISSGLQRVSSKAKAFLRAYRSLGYDDAPKAALSAGYTRGATGYALVKTHARVIERMRLEDQAQGMLTVAEAQGILATLARDPEVPPRDRSSALGLFLRATGVLSDKVDARDGRSIAGELAALLEHARDARAHRTRSRASRGPNAPVAPNAPNVPPSAPNAPRK